VLHSRNKNNELGKSSGILISPNLVLTCSHNLAFIKRDLPRELYKDFMFYPGACGLL
jgi:V8-like Glu-specific endopeptidase